MIASALDDQRCSKCNRLLFKGVLGIGFIEAKCGRCGAMSLIHNFEGILEGRDDAYIVVCDSRGIIILASRSVQKVLGHKPEDIANTSICGLSGEMKLPDNPVPRKFVTLEEWEESKRDLPTNMTQRTKDGKEVSVNARYYPLHAMSGMYTMCVFYMNLPAPHVAISL